MANFTRRIFLKCAAVGTAGFLLNENAASGRSLTELSLPERMLPAPVKGGFSMDDYWVWDPSVVKGEDGLYHMFAPTNLFAATGTGDQPYQLDRSWNMVIPLK
ncbi:hypothetical protein SAMN05421820_103556 [Pedobacter steynii]|uniref:Glycosyl hydrolases family 43 n=1 Tax=Pedobacter steynii TaxID=430522 RepID=A0A1G9SEY7_9SPHI|nr:hypothetical protein [Pedobacter steynii]SDM33355.1 hypothetical protein SAMN05421820_103556 [Pedobacter steynii]